MPDEAEFVCFGLDFGYSADPTALCSIWKMNNELYFVEHCYEKGMTTSDIDNMLSKVVEGRQEIWADSAEPRLIDE
jgi:phage terminase large subunit